jgi:hypothetical protein
MKVIAEIRRLRRGLQCCSSAAGVTNQTPGLIGHLPLRSTFHIIFSDVDLDLKIYEPLATAGTWRKPLSHRFVAPAEEDIAKGC